MRPPQKLVQNFGEINFPQPNATGEPVSHDNELNNQKNESRQDLGSCELCVPLTTARVTEKERAL